jgi:hypothetical protein
MPPMPAAPTPAPPMPAAPTQRPALRTPAEGRAWKPSRSRETEAAANHQPANALPADSNGLWPPLDRPDAPQEVRRSSRRAVRHADHRLGGDRPTIETTAGRSAVPANAGFSRLDDPERLAEQFQPAEFGQSAKTAFGPSAWGERYHFGNLTTDWEPK